MFAWARRIRSAFAFAGGLALLFGSGGCSFGPKALELSHSRYNASVKRVNEEQLLENIIRCRYNESPFKLSVSSIAAQYELAGSAEARPFFIAPNPSNSNIIFKTFTSILPDVSLSGANRPTITLIPSGGEAVRRFLTPIAPETLAYLGSTCWPISTTLRLYAERLNGVPNAPSASGPQRPFAPDFARFQRVAYLLQEAQDLSLGYISAEDRPTELGAPIAAAAITPAAAVEAAKNNLEYRPSGDGNSWVLVRKHRRLILELNPGDVEHPVVKELVSLLNLQPGERKFEIVSSSDIADPIRFPRPPSSELRITPRSTAQVFFFLANGIEVPPEHVAAGLAPLPLAPDGTPFDMRAVTEGLFLVHTSKGHKPPPTAYTAVKYRGYWYYIDDRDQVSKATFALVLQLARIDFAVQEPTGGPFLTLPVGR
jgi:hypothetical protein